MSLQYAILGLLDYQPMTGYDLKQVFDKSINFFWSAQLSQIYRELGTLESKGCVSSIVEPQEGRPDKKIYSITEEGKKALKKWLAKFPQALTVPVRDEFSVRLFFGSGLSREELEFQLKRYIKEKKEELESFIDIEKAIEHFSGEINRPEEKFFWRLVLKRGYKIAEASIHWAEECLEEFKKANKKEV